MKTATHQLHFLLQLLNLLVNTYYYSSITPCLLYLFSIVGNFLWLDQNEICEQVISEGIIPLLLTTATRLAEEPDFVTSAILTLKLLSKTNDLRIKSSFLDQNGTITTLIELCHMLVRFRPLLSIFAI